MLRDAGIELMERDLLRGEPLPDLEAVDGIVSYGGDQSVTEVERYPYLVAEAEFLREAVARGVPVFGICLGGQLLAHALGGEVRAMSARKVQWTPWSRFPPRPVIRPSARCPSDARALNWNEDCFEPPADGVELVGRAGEGCQAFRFGESAWGIQFHPEASAEVVEDWYRSDADFLVQAGVVEADARAADARFMPAQRALCDALFGGFAQLVESAGARA